MGLGFLQEHAAIVSQSRPRVLIAFDAAIPSEIEAALSSCCDLVRDVSDSPGAVDLVLCGGGSPIDVIGLLGEAVAVLEQDGAVVWSDGRFEGLPVAVRTRCTDAAGDPDADIISRVECGGKAWDVHVQPVPGGQNRAVCVVLDMTRESVQQAKLDAICEAGMELTRFDSASVRKLNVAQRLRLVEEKVVRFVHELLDFDNFEIRLLDQRSGQLELVIAENITPLKIGEVICAEEEGNGICGNVAATGRSYICHDVQNDPLYRPGLDKAASSLTVPLWLQDRVIGTFNAESHTAAAFNANDNRMAEIFGRYIATAMHTLDLLVVERYTTNEEIARSILAEIDEPLASIEALADEADDDLSTRLKEAAKEVRQRLLACTAGPQTIIDADRAAEIDADPKLAGRPVLVADDETAMREGVRDILLRLGCEVTMCADGAGALDALQASGDQKPVFDLVISDIRMPGNNGYEIYRAAMELDPDLPVILMTGFGYDPNHSIMRASQEGLHTVLFKPFRAEQLIEAVKKACRTRATC